MYVSRRRRLSQNFLHSHKLVSRLLGNSSIGKDDLVLEIGPGGGIITEQLVSQAGQLVSQAGQVIAVELDIHWYNHLRKKLGHAENLTLYHGDILTFPLPLLPYKVFANIPFAIEGKIIRKLIDAQNPPEDCFLVVMKDLAYRLSGPYRENQFSLQHKPWFSFSIDYHFKPTDFMPVPDVGAVLLRFKLRKQPFLPLKEKSAYEDFIKVGFGQGLPVRQNLRAGYPIGIIDKVLQQLPIPRDTKPGHLTLVQWLSLYKALCRLS